MSAARRLVLTARTIALVFLLLPGGLLAQGPVVRYVYDDLGRLIAVIDPSGQAAFYTYDSVGNLRAIVRGSVTGGVGIIAFAPGAGPVGSSVVILGVGFAASPAANAVAFNGVPASVTSASTTRLAVTVPLEATTGPISVTTAGGAATSGAAFMVDPPTITGFAPDRGGIGAEITITGTGFSAAASNNTVRVGGVLASIVSAEATRLVAAVPAGAATGPIVVTSPRGSATSPSAFTVVPPPTIAGFSPLSGSPDTEVTIAGTGFSDVTDENAVDFNGAFAGVTAATSTELRAIVPRDATTGPIRVTTLGGSATSSEVFTVTALPPPEITGFIPAAAAVGMPVIITGVRFGASPEENVLAFNGVLAEVTAATETELIADVPPGATTGPISVTSPSGSATSATAFGVIPAAPPTITGFSPTSGTIADLITITGTGFAVVPNRNAVMFDGSSQPAFVRTATDTQLTVHVPCIGPTSGHVGPITVTTQFGSVTTTEDFTFTGGFCD